VYKRQTPATTYTWRVRGANATGSGPASATATATTQAVATVVPVAPTGLTVAALASGSQANLSWTDTSTTETGFIVERKTATTSFVEVARLSAGVNAWRDSGLRDGTACTWRVRSFHVAGSSSPSNEASATTPLIPPSSLAIATPGTSGELSLIWADDSSNEQGYAIERAVGAGAFSQVATVAANGTAYRDRGLSAATAYTYRVHAYRSGLADSPASNQVGVTTRSLANATTATRINCGGPASGGFAADAGFTGGNTGSFGVAVSVTGVANAAPAAVYATRREAGFSYAVRGLVASNTYLVRLHFADGYVGAGARSLDVGLNGATVAIGLDAVASAGAFTALVRDFSTVADSNGAIFIDISNRVDNSYLNAFEIIAGASNQAPTVSVMAAAASGTTLVAPATISLAATTNDLDGIVAQVVFYKGTTVIETDTSAPFSITWGNVAAGTYAVTAKATDNLGAVTTSAAISVVVQPGTTGTDTTPPVTPAAPTVADATSAMPQLSGSTEAGAVVRIYDGGSLVATITASGSGEWTWAPATPWTSGTHAVTVTATDAAGNVSGISPTTTITVSAATTGGGTTAGSTTAGSTTAGSTTTGAIGTTSSGTTTGGAVIEQSDGGGGGCGFGAAISLMCALGMFFRRRPTR
jgi:hypothetical protein